MVRTIATYVTAAGIVLGLTMSPSHAERKYGPGYQESRGDRMEATRPMPAMSSVGPKVIRPCRHCAFAATT